MTRSSDASTGRPRRSKRVPASATSPSTRNSKKRKQSVKGDDNKGKRNETRRTSGRIARQKSTSPKRRQQRTSAKKTEKKPKPISVDKRGRYYEIDRILNKRFSKELDTWEYLVRWKDFPPEEDSWEPSDNLCSSAFEEAVRFGDAVGADDGEGSASPARARGTTEDKPEEKNKEKDGKKGKKKGTDSATAEADNKADD